MLIVNTAEELDKVLVGGCEVEVEVQIGVGMFQSKWVWFENSKFFALSGVDGETSEYTPKELEECPILGPALREERFRVL